MTNKATLLSLFLAATASSLANADQRALLDLTKSFCEQKRPYHGDIELKKVLSFNKIKDATLYKCHQVLERQVNGTNSESISLYFSTNLNSENQYFSARLKTDEKYDY